MTSARSLNRLKLCHAQRDHVPLDAEMRDTTLGSIRSLWSYEVVLEERGD